MIIDNIKTKYPKLPYILLSTIIFIFIIKSYIFYIFVVNFDSDIPYAINAALVWSYRICLFLLIIFIKWNTSDVILFIIGGGISYLCRTSTFLIFTILGIYCKTNKISNEYLIKNYLYITAIFFLGIIFLNTFEIIPNGTHVHFRQNSIRNDFGFGNPNSPFLLSVPLYAAYIYLRFDKYDIYDRVLLLSVSVLVYFQTYSRTGLITIFSILIFIEIVKIVNIKNNKIAKFILSYLPILIVSFSFITATCLNFNFFNKLLSGRPQLWNIYIKYITLFGNKQYFELKKLYPLDNGYIYSFVLYGVVFTVLFLALYVYYMKKSFNENNGKVLAVCSIF